MDLRKDLIDLSVFHSQSNRLVERRHDAVINSFAKYCEDRPQDWIKYLPLALWADRVSARRSIGYSAFELSCGREGLLPVEFSVELWGIIEWDEVRSREDLILARMKQLNQG